MMGKCAACARCSISTSTASRERWCASRNASMAGSTISMSNLPCRRAIGGQRAAAAVRLAGVADAAAVPDELMAELRPFLARQALAQVALDLDRVGLAREAQPAGQARHVGVDDEPFVFPVGGSEDHVGGLARHTG